MTLIAAGLCAPSGGEWVGGAALGVGAALLAAKYSPEAFAKLISLETSNMGTQLGTKGMVTQLQKTTVIPKLEVVPKVIPETVDRTTVPFIHEGDDFFDAVDDIKKLHS